MSNYKLSPEIKEFIINQKKSNSLSSCRNLVPLIKERFKITLSKSLINNVIKEANLSSLVGRRWHPDDSLPQVELLQTKALIDNAGYIFLKAADVALSISSNLATCLSVYFSQFSWKDLLKMNEFLIYFESFKKIQLTDLLNYEKSGLWWLIADENTGQNLNEYQMGLSQVFSTDAAGILNKLNIRHNILNINELYKQYLLELTFYAQSTFFPAEYQFLDLSAMRDRFYRLPAYIEKEPGNVKIQFLYPPDFAWTDNPIWLEGISCAIKKFNQRKIFVEKNEVIAINPSIKKPT